MRILINRFDNIYLESDTSSIVGCTNSQYLRYLKGVYTNKDRFMNRYINVFVEKISELKENFIEDYNNIIKFVDFLVDNYDDATPFSLIESFSFSEKEREFQALVFSSINISEMVNGLGATRYKTDGIAVKHRKYDEKGMFLSEEEYHNVYETWEINGEKLGINDCIYTVKCWCTSTNKEHWLWIDEKYKNDPLEAIASTFWVHPNVIEHIKCIKRQGDLLLVEMNKSVMPEGEPVPLKKEQYFNLLVAQS